MILNALSSEMDAEASKQVHLIQASLAQNVKDKKGFYDKLFNKILDFRYKLEFRNPEKELEDERWTDDSAMNKLISKFKSLKSSGEWDELAEGADKIYNESVEAKDNNRNVFLNADREDTNLQWSFGTTEEERKQEEKDRLNKEHGIE